jgi:hypothetical protein
MFGVGWSPPIPSTPHQRRAHSRLRNRRQAINPAMQPTTKIQTQTPNILSKPTPLFFSLPPSLYSWGKQTAANPLGRPDVSPGSKASPAKIEFFGPHTPASMCDCETGYSAAVTRDGSLYVLPPLKSKPYLRIKWRWMCRYTWGSNTYGRLGVGDLRDRASPTKCVGDRVTCNV